MTMIAESRNSWLHKISPWTKIVLMLLGVVLIILIDILLALLVFYVIILTVYISAKLPLAKLKDWYLLPVFIVLSIAIPLTFNRPGTRMIFYLDFVWFQMYLSDLGLQSLLILLIRVLTSVTLSFSFIMTTKYSEIAYLMHKTFPSAFADMLLLTYRYIFLMMDEVAGRINALKARGGSFLGYAANLKNFGALIALSIINGVERGTRLANAMDVRGGGNETIYVNENVKKPGVLDHILVIGLVVFIIMIVLFSFENVLYYMLNLINF